VSGRPPAALLLALTALLVASAPVFAHDGGEGLWGETDDKVVTNAGFFPLFIALMSLLQSQLDKRKQRRKAAAKAREQAPGGW
jgi:hypothetical protein